MSDYAVIVQNDESKWDDVKGDLYHYPSTYQKILTKGCRIVYYKGRLKDNAYLPQRLSAEPHYFGVGIVGDSIQDPDSTKQNRYCEILDYQEFEQAVPARIDGSYLEAIPETRATNYWRFGVREIDRATYQRILSHANLVGYRISLPRETGELESFDRPEGQKKRRYTAYYERNPFYRTKAIELHGLSCMVCGFDFERVYGQLGHGFIHVHHNKPVSETGPTRINPQTDLSVLCPNCHAMVHRNKSHTLTVTELKQLMRTMAARIP